MVLNCAMDLLICLSFTILNSEVICTLHYFVYVHLHWYTCTLLRMCWTVFHWPWLMQDFFFLFELNCISFKILTGKEAAEWVQWDHISLADCEPHRRSFSYIPEPLALVSWASLPENSPLVTSYIQKLNWDHLWRNSALHSWWHEIWNKINYA